RVRRATYGNLSVRVFKPALDDRYADDAIVSHNGTTIIAHAVKSATAILAYRNSDVDIIGVDEVQFFDDEIVQVADIRANSGIRGILASLDTDSRSEPCGRMPKLMSLAEAVPQLNAICPISGSPASRTQRLINGKPASYIDPVI